MIFRRCVRFPAVASIGVCALIVAAIGLAGCDSAKKTGASRGPSKQANTQGGLFDSVADSYGQAQGIAIPRASQGGGGVAFAGAAVAVDSAEAAAQRKRLEQLARQTLQAYGDDIIPGFAAVQS